MVRGAVRFMRATARLRAGDRVFYDAFNDLLAENGGWTSSNDFDVAWKGEGVLAGLRWGSARAFYGEVAFAPGDDRALAPGWLQRLGPFVSRHWPEQPGRAAMTLFAHAAWWLAHPTRADPPSSRSFRCCRWG